MKKQNSDNLQLRSDEVQEILSSPPSWIIRWGISLIFIFTLIVIILANIISYPDFVAAKVVVATKKPSEQIVARLSGAMDQIFVKNGDTVHQGQILAIIRNTAKTDDVYKLKKNIDSMSTNNDLEKFTITHSNTLELGDIEPAFNSFIAHLTDSKLLHNLKPYEGMISGNKLSLEEIKSRLDSQLDQKKILEQELQLEKLDFERHRTLFEKGVISQQEFEAKKRELLQMERNMNAMIISISQLRESMGGASQSLKNTLIGKEEELIRSESNLSQSLNTLKKAIMEWEHSYVLKASIFGKIGFQQFWGSNQYITSGETVFSILPLDSSELVGKLVLPSQNAGKIKLGQKVLIKLDNFPYQQYGMLVGKVENISVSPDNEGNYFVYVSLPNTTKTSYNQILPFEQELLGNAEIITEELTIAERIFYKFKNIFSY